ncbi:MAG: PSD1 and planctomycete cytochrome C domain-containing protein [Planctomycetota bacterium]|nr:PSD1 and planctomycete cytochrome C domain-containing protein [Planctomycetota bacterium]
MLSPSLLLFATPLLGGGATPPEQPRDLAAEVRPLLAKRCGVCHGPDAGTREAELRLDQAADLFGDRGGYRVVVPGDPADSELWLRLTDPEDPMPPEGEPRLEPHELELLEAWIASGATWSEHWSYVPPTRPEPPVVEDPAWPRNDLDRFVLARLEAEGLTPSPPADPTTLARRAALDLTGLPPDLATLDAFLAASERDPDAAWTTLIEGLLASPAHAEHQAAAWLDLARYADTNGYEKDSARTMWRYRDWVIDAFARDLAFDEFTRLQLAGDLLDQPSTDDLIATGFHRNTMVNAEGGTDPEEFRVAAVMDRVDTTAAVWLGATMGCARCHTHKFDPITHDEYYATFALFNDTADDGNALAPTIPAPTAQQSLDLIELEDLVADREARLTRPDLELDVAQAKWEAELLALPAAPAPELGPWQATEPHQADSFQAAFEGATPAEAQVLAGADPFRGFAPAWELIPELVDGEVLPLSGDRSAFLFCREVHSERPQDLRLSLGSDDGIKVWLNGIAVHTNPAQRAATPGEDVVDVRLPTGRSLLLVKVVNGGGPGGFVFEAGPVLPDGLAPGDLALLAAPERSDADSARLRRLFRSQHTEAGAAAATELATLNADLAALRAAIPTAPILQPAMEPRATHVLAGGNFLAPLDAVGPGLPAAFGPPADEMPTDRLELAAWLADPRNPVTTRVVVNRMWQRLFGIGLVATVDDLGSQGEPPSHPELLDWLAVELVESGWDTEQLLRTILCSATWRQASVLTPELLERDPQNRLLARGARYRLTGEALRDVTLAAAGLLDRTVGGPSVFPPQPDGTWAMTYSGERWDTATDGDRWRRGLYTFRRRTAPYPTLALFDAPSRELVCTSRARTNTPLQALALWNDPAFVEAAGGLARLVLGELPAGDDAARIDLAFRRCTSRWPSAEERGVLLDLLTDERARFVADPERAAALVASDVLETSAVQRHGEVETAAWTLVASVLLNLDEVLNRE